MGKRLTAFLLVLILLLSCLQTGEAEIYKRLRKGSRGEAVKQLQAELKKKGYYPGETDGIFGNATLRAVKAFQRDNGLKADGIAGPRTLEKLFAGRGRKETTEGVVSADDGIDAASEDLNTGKTEQAVHADVISFLESVANQSGAACGSLVLSKNGKVFLKWSFGGVDENTCFRIASITKWVTAIGLMTLYDQGKLELDKDISTYLGFKVRNPAFPDVPVTARMLLTHTSSLSSDATNYHPDWARIGKKGYDPVFNEDVKPGTKYEYADYNGALFGCLIEAIAKQSVQNYLNEKVFRPLGLTAAYSPKFLPAGTATKDLLDPNGKAAITVQKDMKRAYNNKPDPKGNNGYTVGKLYINTDSLTRLAQMMYFGGELNGVRILKTETVRLMESDQPFVAESRYGLSTVRMKQFDRGTWYGHQGRYSGLSSNVYYQRETGITIALVMDGYDYQLEDNVVLPAVSLLKNMEKIETMCLQSEKVN